MPADNETKAIVADILSELISYIKESRPTRSDGTSTQGYVYSQMRIGQMVSPRDFAAPWTPMGGSGSAQAAAAVAQQRADGPNDGSAAALASAAAAKRANQAAYNLTQLTDTMLIVTNDGTMETYSGGGRHLAITYKGVIGAMEPSAPPTPPTPEEEATFKEIYAVLYDQDGNETPEYARYLKNSMAHAKARTAFVQAQNTIAADPLQADSLGALMVEYEEAVHRAYDKWIAQGAEKIERALAFIGAQGVPLEQGMINNARYIFEQWSFPMGGAAVKTPFSYVLPTEWADINIDDIGWTRLEKNASTYQRHYDSNGYNISTGNWQGDSSQSSGSGGIGIFGFGFGGSYSESDSSSSREFRQSNEFGDTLTDDATNLSIDFEYGIVQIVRPWLITDLFHLRHWKMDGAGPKEVSDGTINGQVGNATKIMPLIPTHFLCIRNVTISAQHWGSVKTTLERSWGRQGGSESSSSSSGGGGFNVPLCGFISLSASAHHSESHYDGGFTDEGGRFHSDDYGARFEGEKLTIKGTQIVAWLSEIVPAAPPEPAA
jgi:hypothetical protein